MSLHPSYISSEGRFDSTLAAEGLRRTSSIFYPSQETFSFPPSPSTPPNVTSSNLHRPRRRLFTLVLTSDVRRVTLTILNRLRRILFSSTVTDDVSSVASSILYFPGRHLCSSKLALEGL